MITLRPVERADLRPLFALKVAPGQERHVAPNEITLAQAAHEPGSNAFAIRDDERIVGLLAALDFREHDDVHEGEDPEAAYLWRLLIGAEHQRKGYGRAAVELFLDWARGRGNPVASVSVVPGNEDAAALYRAMGFAATGVLVDGEIVMDRPLY